MRVCAHTCRQLHHGRTPTRSVRLGGVGGYCHVRPVQADGIKQKLSESLVMSQWHAVWNFQNEALNAHMNEKAILHYMTPDILSNMVFDREFPLGVEERIIRERQRYAIQHSGLHQVGGTPHQRARPPPRLPLQDLR